ncbi:MAG: hypothetical protein WC942_06385, partial [Clostridia bacterium]
MAKISNRDIVALSTIFIFLLISPFLLIKWTVQIIKWIIQVIEKANQNKKEQELYNKQEKLRIEENKHQQE